MTNEHSAQWHVLELHTVCGVLVLSVIGVFYLGQTTTVYLNIVADQVILFIILSVSTLYQLVTWKLPTEKDT